MIYHLAHGFSRRKHEGHSDSNKHTGESVSVNSTTDNLASGDSSCQVTYQYNFRESFSRFLLIGGMDSHQRYTFKGLVNKCISVYIVMHAYRTGYRERGNEKSEGEVNVQECEMEQKTG